MKRTLFLLLAFALAGGGVLVLRRAEPTENASPSARAVVPTTAVAPAAAPPAVREDSIASGSPAASAPSLKSGDRNDFSEDDMRFLLERVQAGDREFVVLYGEYREKLKKAEFSAEVATVARTEGPPLSKVGESLVSLDVRVAEGDLSQARTRIQQLIYYRRRNGQ